MSPLTIHALLEFQTLDYPNTEGGYATNPEAIRQLRRDGMIKTITPFDNQYELTKKGRDLFSVIVAAAGSGLTTAESIWTELAKKAVLEVTDGNIGTGPDMDVVPFVIACFVSQADRIKEMTDDIDQMRVLTATSTLIMTEAEKEIEAVREELEKYKALAASNAETIEWYEMGTTNLRANNRELRDRLTQHKTCAVEVGPVVSVKPLCDEIIAADVKIRSLESKLDDNKEKSDAADRHHKHQAEVIRNLRNRINRSQVSLRSPRPRRRL